MEKIYVLYKTINPVVLDYDMFYVEISKYLEDIA